MMVLKFFTLFFMLVQDKIAQMDPKRKAELSKLELEFKNITLFSLVWSFGSILSQDEREAMNKFIHALIKGKDDVNESYKLGLKLVWQLDEKIVAKVQVSDD